MGDSCLIFSTLRGYLHAPFGSDKDNNVSPQLKNTQQSFYAFANTAFIKLLEFNMTSFGLRMLVQQTNKQTNKQTKTLSKLFSHYGSSLKIKWKFFHGKQTIKELQKNYMKNNQNNLLASVQQKIIFQTFWKILNNRSIVEFAFKKVADWRTLTLSWRRPISYRNQSKSMEQINGLVSIWYWPPSWKG